MLGPRTSSGRWAARGVGPERGLGPSGKRGPSARSCHSVKPYRRAGTSTPERPRPPLHLQPFPDSSPAGSLLTSTPSSPGASMVYPAAAVREPGADRDPNPQSSHLDWGPPVPAPSSRE